MASSDDQDLQEFEQTSVPSNLQNNLLWPIQCKGAAQQFLFNTIGGRLNPLSDPLVEQFYHKAMEQGRMQENSISDAMFQIQQKSNQINTFIATHLNLNRLAVNGQPDNPLRTILLVADSILFLRTIVNFQRDITLLIQALTQNIGLLLAIEQNVLRMVQANLNAIANLLYQICNWGIPPLPSIPNLFPDGMWYWNGFNFFPLANFKALLGFNFNFAFGQCTRQPSNTNIFSNVPSTVTSYSGQTYGSPIFTPPLSGSLPAAGQSLTDPTFISQMQATTTAVYNPDTFNPNSSMLGSVPDPSTIISNYQMPPQTYRDNIVSIVPALRGDVIEPSDADYNNPDLTTRQANLRRDLVHYVTLQQVVDSNYDPNLTAAWLFYMDTTRTARGGVWIPNLETAYETYISPSVVYLIDNAVPWNNVLGGNGVQDAPTAIPLIGTITSAPLLTQLNILWKLSYLEAALLGYTRTKSWDGGADNNYVSGFTGTDLDYQPTTLSSDMSSEILGSGQAQYPVACSFPTAIKTVLDEVIAAATINIDNDPSYQSPHPRFKFVYDQFAEATLVDRFSQFWREFNANLQNLLVQDPYLVSFVVTYEGALDSAIDPLGDPTDYQVVAEDAATRNRLWTPGQPLLNIPQAPILLQSSNSIPTAANNGWINPPFELDPNAFLSRPDVQAQPISVQIAMLRTNLSFAGLNTFASNFSQDVNTIVNTAQTALNQTGQLGFEVDDDNATTFIPVGPNGLAVAFDTTTFDMTGNVTSSTAFTLQSAGSYAAAGQINWGAGAGGTRTITLIQNGNPVYSIASDPTAAGPLEQQFSTTVTANVKDVFQVIASHNLSTAQSVVPGGFFIMLQQPATTTAAASTTSGGGSSSSTTTTTSSSITGSFTADASFPVLTAVAIQPDGGVLPLIPTIPAITSVGIAGNILTVISNNTFAAGNFATFLNLVNASFLNGSTVTITSASSTGFTASFVHSNYGPTAETNGQAVLSLDTQGVLAVPSVDGVALEAGISGNAVSVALSYGGLYEISGVTLTTGGLLYVTPNGTLTQNFASLSPTLDWLICVGRAVSPTTFIYEPHIPILYSQSSVNDFLINGVPI